MTRRLLLSYLFLALFVLAVLELPLGLSYARNERQDLRARVERDAVTFATLAEDILQAGGRADRATLGQIARQYQRQTAGRIVIVGAKGTTLVNTDPPEPGSRDLVSRPEIARALRGDRTSGVRQSAALGTDVLYVAEPVASGGEVHGVVRISYPTAEIERRITRFWLLLAVIALVVLLAASLIGHRFALSITKPLRDLERAAAAAGSKDLKVRAPVDAGPPEVRSLAEGFNDTVEKLDELIRSQEEFVADAAHQLRTPLAALRLRLENVEPTVAARGRADFDGAVVEVDRLSRLVDGLLLLARADAAVSAAEELDVAEIVEERLEAWSALAGEHGVEFVSALGEGLNARATPGKLEQVLDNLLANALDATPPEAQVTVSALRADDWVELHVIDEGPGMSAEERARAFDRLWSAGAADRGFGLGLAIVRSLVVSDGGEVQLLPASGGGLDAVVRLRAGAVRAHGVRPSRERVASF